MGADDLEHANDMPKDELGTTSYRDRSLDQKILALSKLKDKIFSERDARAYGGYRTPTHAHLEHAHLEHVQHGSQFANDRFDRKKEGHSERMLLYHEAPMRTGSFSENMQIQEL